MTVAARKSSLPRAVAQYAHIGRSIASLGGYTPVAAPLGVAAIAMVMARRDADMQKPAQSAKVKRNESCPCGSGKKYKKCCGATVH